MPVAQKGKFVLPVIVRNIVYPLHETLLRRATLRYVRELESSQWLSPDEVLALQRKKLAVLFRHMHTHTSFYRERLMQAGVDFKRSDPFDTLRRLPLLDKTEIRASLDKMIWPGAPGGLFKYNTGGSVGEPLTFYFDRRRQGYDQASRIRSHRWFDANIGDRELYLWGSPIELHASDRVKRARDYLFNHKLLDAFDMSNSRMAEYLDEIERFKPVRIFGYPSSLALLANFARSVGRDMRLPTLKVAFTTGEVCYQQDRDIIGNCFGVPVADGYGSREAGFIAHECPQGSLHLASENVIVEVVDGDRPVPVGQDGELVVTHLDAYAMPFVRYRIGDTGRLKAGRCACGRGLPMMDVVKGRTTDFVTLPDGRVRHALSVIYPIRDVVDVKQFNVTQDEDHSVLVNIVCSKEVRRATQEAVERGLRPVLGGDVVLRVNTVDRIDVLGSGKHRYVVSKVKSGASEFAGESDRDN